MNIIILKESISILKITMNTAIQIITLIFLGYYTFYTKKLAQESIKTNTQTFMPFLKVLETDLNLAIYENNISFKGIIKLVNIGKGPAVDVWVENIKIGWFEILFKRNISLITNEHYNWNPDTPTSIKMSGKKKLNSKLKRNDNILKIHCKDQLGNHYCFKYDISNLNINPKYIEYELNK